MYGNAKSEETQQDGAQIAVQISFQVMFQTLIGGEGGRVYPIRVSLPKGNI